MPAQTECPLHTSINGDGQPSIIADNKFKCNMKKKRMISCKELSPILYEGYGFIILKLIEKYVLRKTIQINIIE